MFLVGCREEKEYKISGNNVESFYDIDLDYEIKDDGFRYNLSLDDKYKMSSENFAISFEIVFKVHKTTGGYTYQGSFVYNLQEFEHTEFFNDRNISEVELHYIYVTYSQGYVYSKSRIKVKVKTYKYLTNPPFTGELVKEDEVEENIVLNNKLQERMDYFNIESKNKVKIKNSISTIVKKSGNTLSSSTINQTIHLQNTPFYMHSYSLGINTIVFENNNNLFIGMYNTINTDGKNVVTPIYSELPEFPTNETINEYEIDPTKMKIVEDNDSFIVTAYVADILDEETYEMLTELYDSLDIDPSVLDSSIVSVIYTFYSDEVKIETNVSVRVESIETNVKLTIEISFEDFELIDVTDEERFVIEPSNMMTPAMPYSELDKQYSSEVNTSDEPHYYKFEIEAGQYDLTTPKYGFPYVKIYDSNFNLLNTNIFLESGRIQSHIGYTFIIPSDGTYYLEYMQNITLGGYEMMLSKLDYKSIFDKNNMSELTTGKYKLEFEGYKDIIGYTINVPRNAAIKLSVPSEEDFGAINVLYEHKGYLYDSNNMTETGIYNNYETFIAITKNNQNFYFYPIEFDENKVYELEIEIIKSNDYLSSDYNNMPILTEEFTKVPIITGALQDPSYLKFSIIEAGQYRFVYDLIKDFGTEVELYTKYGQIVDVYNKYSKFDLEVGDYYIKVYYGYFLDIFNLAIEKVE